MNRYFKDGQIVLFQGDSVTDCDRIREDKTSLGLGYPMLIEKIYNEYFPENTVKFINKGVSGDRVCDVLARYNEDIKDTNPDFISILIGINDVWRRYDNNMLTTIEEFENNYKTLLSKIKSDFPNTKIMMLEPFLLHSDAAKIIWHEDLDPKIQVVRKLANEYADYYVALDGIMAEKAVESSATLLAGDGVHPSDFGHKVIAEKYLNKLEII